MNEHSELHSPPFIRIGDQLLLLSNQVIKVFFASILKFIWISFVVIVFISSFFSSSALVHVVIIHKHCLKVCCNNKRSDENERANGKKIVDHIINGDDNRKSDCISLVYFLSLSSAIALPARCSVHNGGSDGRKHHQRWQQRTEQLIFVRCISFHLVKMAKSPTANKIAVSL